MDLIGRYGLTRDFAAPAPSPLDLTLDFWWRADDVGVTVNGDPVTSVVDKSGNGVTWESSGTNRPTLVSADTGISSEPSLNFSSASSQYLANIGAGFLNYRNNRDHTEYIVFRSNFPAGGRKMLASTLGTTFTPYFVYGLQDGGGDPIRYYGRGGMSLDTVGTELAYDDSWHLLVVRTTVSGATATLRAWVDGVLDKDTTYDAVNDFSTFDNNTIAATRMSDAYGEFWSGRVADHWCSGAADSLATINDMGSYVADRYGLTIGTHS